MNIHDFAAVIFDLDGTIYYGPDLIEGAIEAVDFFKKKGLKVFFGTNNSSKTRKTICDKLNSLGIICQVDEIITSGYLTAVFCAENAINDVYIFGTKELAEEFKEQGVLINQTEKATNLVIGFDKDFNYNGFTSALRVALNSKNIIACNIERNFPGDMSLLFPSCGGIVKAIEWCSNKSCTFIAGKPNSFMVDYLREKYQISKKILIIGDSFEFDVKLAYNSDSTPIYIGNGLSLDCPTIDCIGNVLTLFEHHE